jgi:hypothetical protein
MPARTVHPPETPARLRRPQVTLFYSLNQHPLFPSESWDPEDRSAPRALPGSRPTSGNRKTSSPPNLRHPGPDPGSRERGTEPHEDGAPPSPGPRLAAKAKQSRIERASPGAVAPCHALILRVRPVRRSRCGAPVARRKARTGAARSLERSDDGKRLETGVRRGAKIGVSPHFSAHKSSVNYCPGLGRARSRSGKLEISVERNSSSSI